MLTHLSIKNIVLIEAVELSFDAGLCVLTGETGAGKSILLDSLGLALGARADSSLVRSGETQGSVSAEFDITRNEAAKQLLDELQLEAADTLLVRRTLSTDGKSRIWVNDTTVTQAALKRLGEALVEINGQHDQKTLQDTGLHRMMLDEYGASAKEREQVRNAYQQWKSLRDKLAQLQADIAQAQREQDYLSHMHKDLKQLSPQAGEEEQLAEQRSRMMGSEKLFETLNAAIGELSGKDVLGALRNAQKTLLRSPLTSGFTHIIDGLEKAGIEAEEALYALEKAGEESRFDPKKLEQVEERLFALKAAARKYQVTADELAGLHDEVARKLELISSQSHESGRLEKQVAEARSGYIAAAAKLTEARQKSASKLEKSIAKELAPLKMEGTHFRVRIEPAAEVNWSEQGADSVAFECATNVSKGSKDVVYSPLSKIASGGELSRFMLAMKVALSAVRSTPTIIFDEIDTGTGGAVADAIGKRLAQLGESSQVLVVTHLPQVAARGSQHLLIAKGSKSGKITTQVTALSREQREEELARMLAGATITAEARKAAAKLLEQAA